MAEIKAFVLIYTIARMSAVAPTFPHHITQTGNRRQQTFFSDQEFEAYLNLDVGMVPEI
ncbi:hypothetical protein [Desulfobacter sp.]|uniref:hypothetical protein n=1 Tax=Desulfobacter sp. TaxID=2294 RepID=UPI003D0DCC19